MFFHLFCKRLWSVYHFPRIHDTAAPLETQSPRVRVPGTASAHGVSEGAWRSRPDPRASPAVAAPGLRAPEGGTAPLTCTRTGRPGSRVPGAVPSPGAGGSSVYRSGGRQLQAGRVPACAASAYARLRPKPRLCPAHLFSRARAPRAPSRARARACAGQGPPGAAP